MRVSEVSVFFKYCPNVENCESFRGFGYIYIYIYIDSNNNKHLLSLLGNMLVIMLYHLGITIQYVDRDNISKKEM